jgi:hypothetical protein
VRDREEEDELGLTRPRANWHGWERDGRRGLMLLSAAGEKGGERRAQGGLLSEAEAGSKRQAEAGVVELLEAAKTRDSQVSFTSDAASNRTADAATTGANAYSLRQRLLLCHSLSPSCLPK